MRDYREKSIKGCIFDLTSNVLMPKACDVAVRMTSDKIGQSLSLQAYNVMIEIPLESVRDIIRVSGKGDADIEIGGKKYRLTDAPILKTRDKSGLCSICGFREVDE